MKIPTLGIRATSILFLLQAFYTAPLETIRKVSYGANVMNFLSHNYSGQTKEVPFCMVGKEANGSFEVTDLRFPYITRNSVKSSTYIPCDLKEYVGMVHNHVDGNCSPSKVDMERFRADKKARLETIVCGINGNKVRMVTFFK